ncbi:MAG: aminotransferase class III-fold pyridoxal phosphate-dependent enzyme [Burkholderiales bacterium]
MNETLLQSASEWFRWEIGMGWLGAALVLALLVYGRQLMARLMSLRAISPTPAISRFLSKWVGTRHYSEEGFLSADGAPEAVQKTRAVAMQRLAQTMRERCPKSEAWGMQVRDGLSDLRFADANRVPFPFAKVMREKFNLCSVAVASEGPYIVDMDGNRNLDIGGSYGVNVAGYDRYKTWLDRGWAKVRDLGPVLGPLHPIAAENISMLKEISGLEEVSFHQSGTEAVMAAVRLARFNTEREKIVCFSGAYHGWWDGVQPGLGSERFIDDCLTLKEMNPASLDAIRRHAHQLAGVLVNPVQSFHPNSPPPNDAVMMTSGIRKTRADVTSSYSAWLAELRAVCDECRIPLIFDEVFTGFRLAPGGAQEYFGVKADMVLYGKTVAAGVPIGVVCAKRGLMRRFDPEHPMRIAYVVGTFSAYPLAMGAMNEFLHWVRTPEAAAEYQLANQRCAAWAKTTNEEFAAAALPVRVGHLGTIWTVLYSQPGRYNWLLQYYLRLEGINMSWVGTGRCLTSLDYTEADYDALRVKLREATAKMKNDKWWLSETEQPERDRDIRRGLTREFLGSLLRLPRPVGNFYTEIMRRKHDDHVASHSHPFNQFLHLISSSSFVVAYVLIFSDFAAAMWLGLAALFLRQMGHALVEPPCHDKEQLLLGFDTRTKSIILGAYLLIPAVHLAMADVLSGEVIMGLAPTIAKQWFGFTALVVFGRVAVLIRKHGLYNASVWFVKLITDPFTDIKAYYRSLGFLKPSAP